MKKLFLICLLLLASVCIWFFVKHRSLSARVTPVIVETNQVPAQIQADTPVKTIAGTQLASGTAITAHAAESAGAINALAANTLEQWQAGIKGLKSLGDSKTRQNWLMEQPGRKSGQPVELSLGGQSVSYGAVLISVTATNDEHGGIVRIEMQTPNMNIDETRALGLQICNLLGLEPADFQAWCDRVGNHWLDAPLYGSKAARDPGSHKMFAFQTLMTYNNEKPWMINFLIMSP